MEYTNYYYYLLYFFLNKKNICILYKKLQQLEQINYNSFINLHKYCMIEIYPLLIYEYIKNPPQDVVLLNKKNVPSQKSNDIKNQRRNIRYNIRYSNLVFTNTTEKLLLKLIVRNEWKKVSEKISHSLSSYEGNLQEQALYKLSIERKEKVYYILNIFDIKLF